MSFRSLGNKVFNNAKVLINTQSTVSSHQIINNDNDDNKQQQQDNEKNYHSNINQPPSIKQRLNNSNRSMRKKRQRMHFRPIIPQHYICPITQVTK